MKFLRTIVVVCALLHPCITAHATVRYTITDLGTLGGEYSRAAAINSNGWVVGYSETLSGDNHAFLWKPGAMMNDLGTPVGSDSTACAINDNGQVAGTLTPENGLSRAATWLPDQTIVALPEKSGVSDFYMGRGINSRGQIIGSAGYWLGVSWLPNGDVVSVPMSGLISSDPWAVNDSGLIVGGCLARLPSGGGDGRAAYWQGTQVGFLPSFQWRAPATASAVNDANQIVGRASKNGVYHPVLWTSFHTMVDLGTLGGDGGANALNSSSQVVGYCKNADNLDRAFIWDSTTGMLDLNTLIDPPLGWTLTKATGINNSGWIVGNGTINGQTHGFLLTPIPEPGGLLVLGSGLVALLARNR